MKRCMVIAASIVLFISTWGTAFAQVPVTECGQTVEGDAYLTGDLDCTGFSNHGVIINHGGLELRGFTVTGGNAYGVGCFGSCKIVGPGTITGSGLDGVRGVGRVSIFNVTITGNGSDGVDARNNWGRGRAVVKNSVITGNGSSGVQADRRANVSGSSVSGNGAHGVEVGTYGCDRPGRLIVRDSTITGNGIDATCGVSRKCADLATCDTPRVDEMSSCETSYELSSGFPGATWGVCSLD